MTALHQLRQWPAPNDMTSTTCASIHIYKCLNENISRKYARKSPLPLRFVPRLLAVDAEKSIKAQYSWLMWRNWNSTCCATAYRCNQFEYARPYEQSCILLMTGDWVWWGIKDSNYRIRKSFRILICPCFLPWATLLNPGTKFSPVSDPWFWWTRKQYINVKIIGSITLCENQKKFEP